MRPVRLGQKMRVFRQELERAAGDWVAESRIMKNEPSTLAPRTPEDLLHGLRAIVADSEKLLGATLTQCASESSDGLRTRFAAAQKRLAEVYEGASIKFRSGERSADETVRAHPYETVVLALGVGALLGVLLHRKGPTR
jgi:ElaB/YqjD/DUF883 family membrane-anchored ribosome-binding protein